MRANFPRYVSTPKPKVPDFIASTDDVFIFNPGSGVASVCAYTQDVTGHRVAPPASRSQTRGPNLDSDMDARVPGFLAPIVSDTLDPDAILALDPGNSSLRHALAMLQDLSEWEPHMLVPWSEIPSFFARGTSRRMIKHHARLVHYLVVRDVRQSEIKVVTNMFTVDKKDASLRLVVDGRKVNVLMEPPPRMELPSIQDVITYVMSNNYALTVDGTSYFYQFAISEEVGTMFCANLAAERGSFRPVAMTRMPMGWAYAPYIAQKVSNTLLRGKDGRVLGMAWIDNFLFAGSTKEEVQANFDEFLENCDKCKVQIDDRKPSPSSTLSALGIYFDMSTKQYSLDPLWVDKRVFTLDLRMTPRHLYEITGCAIWHDYVKRIPLCHRSECIDIIRRVASIVTATAAWDTPVDFPPKIVTRGRPPRSSHFNPGQATSRRISPASGSRRKHPSSTFGRTPRIKSGPPSSTPTRR